MENDGVGEGGATLEMTKITKQTKCKFYMHWIVLIVAHIFVFWYIPISGNTTLYGTPRCMDPEKNDFGCTNFHKNGFLRLFYFFILMFIMLSALQIKYGLPTSRIASSVTSSYTFGQYMLAVAYQSIPFAIEVRCILDYTFSKTSLDNF